MCYTSIYFVSVHKGIKKLVEKMWWKAEVTLTVRPFTDMESQHSCLMTFCK